MLARLGSLPSGSGWSFELKCMEWTSVRRLVPPARLKLALLDPQRVRELGIVASDLLDEALGVLAASSEELRETAHDERVEPVIPSKYSFRDGMKWQLWENIAMMAALPVAVAVIGVVVGLDPLPTVSSMSCGRRQRTLPPDRRAADGNALSIRARCTSPAVLVSLRQGVRCERFGVQRLRATGP
jgi:hypothetical protein